MNIFKQDGWIATALLVLGGLGTVTAVLSWLFSDATVVLAFAAGAGWALAIPLLIMLYERNKDIQDLRDKVGKLEKTEEDNQVFFRRDLEELRYVQTLNAETLNVFATRAFGAVKATARRKSATLPPPARPEEEE